MTTAQMRDKTKSVTRRFGWWFVKPGDEIWAVEKAMGLTKGEGVVRIAKIRIVSTRREPLHAITKSDCIKEGFPHFAPKDFIKMLQEHYGNKITPETECNRIEFEFVDE